MDVLTITPTHSSFKCHLYILQNKITYAFWKVASTTPLLQIRPVWLSQILTGKKLNDDNKRQRQGIAYDGIKGAKLFSPIKIGTWLDINR